MLSELREESQRGLNSSKTNAESTYKAFLRARVVKEIPPPPLEISKTRINNQLN
jgi:hypothetical protein